MRSFTNIEKQRLQILTENSVEITVIEPTSTGLKKFILDATGPVRGYLKAKDIHDYSIQKQGEINKILIPSYLVGTDKIISTSASLYRPISKKGDPRIWFKKLPEYSKPNDILAIIDFKKELYVINITQIDIVKLIESPIINPIKELIGEIRSINNFIANELLLLLQNIADRGPVPGMLKADTSIGRTLEALLGIDINSSKKPDYKGIEIKSYRDERDNRKSLFTQVPSWSISKFKSSAEILKNFGYYNNEGEFRLYCTVTTKTRNSQGLLLKINQDIQVLIENSDKSKIGDFVYWQLDILHNRLLEKHNETFWIAADTITIDGKEHFQYKKVEHTKKPILSQFDILLEQGLITLDHLIKQKPNGQVLEKGPSFKIKSNAISLLFPPSKIYNLI